MFWKFGSGLAGWSWYRVSHEAASRCQPGLRSPELDWRIYFQYGSLTSMSSLQCCLNALMLWQLAFPEWVILDKVEAMPSITFPQKWHTIISIYCWLHRSAVIWCGRRPKGMNIRDLWLAWRSFYLTSLNGALCTRSTCLYYCLLNSWGLAHFCLNNWMNK